MLGDRMEKAGNRIGGAINGLAKAGLAVSGAFAATGILNFAQDTFKAASEIKRSAAIAGAGIEEFQQAAHAAKSVGIESDKLADIYKDVNDKIGEFIQTGGGELKDFFDNIAPKVGVTADNFKNLSGPEALQLYVSTLEKARVPHKDMTFYMEAIADDATRLIPLLQNNGAEYKRLAQSANDLGIVLSKEQIQNADRTAAKIDDLRKVLSVRIGGIVLENTGAINSFVDALDGLAKWLSRGEQHLARLQAWKRALSTGFALGAFPASAARLQQNLDGVVEAARRATGTPAPKAAAAPAPARNLIASGRSGTGLTPFPTAVRTPPLLAKFAGGSDANPFGAPGRGDFSSVFTVPEALQDVAAAVNDAAANFDRFGERAKFNADRTGESFKDAADATLAALDRVAGAIKGGGFLGILEGVIGLGIQLGSVGVFGKKTAKRINGYAAGTMSAARGLALVGERGPELVNFRGGERVFPNGSIGGGKTVVEIVDTTGLFVTRVNGQIMQAAPAIAQGGAIGAQRLMARQQTRRLA